MITILKKLLKKSDECPVDHRLLNGEHLNASLSSARKIKELLEEFATGRQSIVTLLLNGKEHKFWDHYPWQGGILDQRSQSQYFYHSHADYRGEHGHIHTFIYHKRKLVHLVAIGINKRGRPNKLYTFNRWSPGDHYYPAAQLKKILRSFSLSKDNSFNPKINSFVSHTLQAYQAEIDYLFDQRDRCFTEYREKNNGQSPFEDRSLEITSSIRIDIDTQLDRLEHLSREVSDALPKPVAAHAAIPAESIADERPAYHPIADRSEQALQQALASGRQFLALDDEFKRGGGSLLDVVVGDDPIEDWKMYPWDGGVVDPKSKHQFFYHAHPQSPEHGHFHTFYYYKNQIVHLIAVALDNRGNAIELMTLNRWVTGDLFLPAKKIKNFMPHFKVQSNAFDVRVYRWLRCLFDLYRVEIETLLDQRDHCLNQYRIDNDGKAPFEDRSLELTSTLPIDAGSHIATLDRELRNKTHAASGH